MIITACQPQKEVSKFQLHGKSNLTVENQTNDSIAIHFENWYILPWKSQKIDTTLAPGTQLDISIISQGMDYCHFSYAGQNLKLFTQPHATDTIVLHATNKAPLFKGDSKKVNTFLWKKSEHFQSVDSEWLHRTNFTHANNKFTDVIQGNDSITQTHLNYLKKQSDLLPDDYTQFEEKRLRYLNAQFQLNSFLYRTRMLKKKDTVPHNFLENLTQTITINNETMLGTQTYTLFLNDYIAYNMVSLRQKNRSSEFNDMNRRTTLVNQELKGLVKDFYWAFSLANKLAHNQHLFQQEWLGLINNEELKEFITQLSKTKPVLPKGSPIPYFYLVDESNTHYTPSRFKGKTTLIHFWATYCKPCIKKFPKHNEMVKKFKEEEVEIVTICIESDSVQWKKYLQKFELQTTNLFAKKQWSDNLRKSFNIKGLPHSILIAPDGKVIQNHCSNLEMEKLIKQALKRN